MEGHSSSTYTSSPYNSIYKEQLNPNRQTLIATRIARPQTEWHQMRNVSATVTSADWKPTIHGDSEWPVSQFDFPEELIKTPVNSTDHSLSTSTWHETLNYELNWNGLHDSPQTSSKELNETSDAASHQDTLIDPTMSFGNVPIEENKISSHERPTDHDDLISVPVTSHIAAKIKPIGEEKFPVTIIHPMNIGNVSIEDRRYNKPFEAEKWTTPALPAKFVFSTNSSNVEIEGYTNWPPHSSEEHILSDTSIPTASIPSDLIPPSQRPNIVQTPNVVQTPNITQTPNVKTVKTQKRPYKRKEKIRVQSNERIKPNQMTSKSSLKLPFKNETEPNSLKRKNTETLLSHAPAKMNFIPPTRNETVANTTSVASLKRKNQEKSLPIPAKKPAEYIKNGPAVTDARRDKQNSSGQSYEDFVKFLSRNDVSVFKVPPSPVPTKPLPVRQEPLHIDWEKYRRIFRINNVTIERVRN